VAGGALAARLVLHLGRVAHEADGADERQRQHGSVLVAAAAVAASMRCGVVHPLAGWQVAAGAVRGGLVVALVTGAALRGSPGLVVRRVAARARQLGVARVRQWRPRP
jgi:hypothetical protein